MTEFQKVIKAIAIGLAIFLIVIIIGSLFSLLSMFGFIADGFNSVTKEQTLIEYENAFNPNEIDSMKIDNAVGKVCIQKSDTDQIEVTGTGLFPSFSCHLKDNGELVIRNSEKNFFNWNFTSFFHQREDNSVSNTKIEIFVPLDYECSDMVIASGVGEMKMNDMIMEHLTIDGGVGNIICERVVAQRADIGGGVGSMTFTDVDLQNLDLDIGTGDVSISGVLSGDCELDCGVGKAELDLTGNVEDYDFSVDSGVGSIRINGERIEETNHTNKGAENSFRIEGGVGSITITMEE